MNALRASTKRVFENPWFGALFDALGIAFKSDSPVPVNTDALRYKNVVLLFDPDADGIHCGALMLMFFYRFMPDLLAQERILMVRAPLFRVTSDRLDAPAFATSKGHYDHIVAQLKAKDVHDFQTLRYRGLGSLEESILNERCIDPETRTADIMRKQDARMAIEIFSADSLDQFSR